MKIVLTEDLELVATILQHPDLFDRITDDAGSSLTGASLLAHLKDKEYCTFYLKVTDDSDKVQGVFECTELEDGSLELHPNMLASGRKAFGAWACKKVINLLFECTDYTKLIGKVPSLRGDVLAFISSIGFKLEFMVEKEYIKNNVEYDMYYLSLSKGV